MATGRIVTLTTDFGQRDPFVGIVKGVILGICRDAMLFDLTHEIAPIDILEGAFALESACRFFPMGTIHLAVVDPGVGGRRRALALESGGHYFVGPDNGLFSFVLMTDEWSAVAIEAPAYRRSEVSRTFHGRDVFAPAAGHLAAGVPLGHLGPRITDPTRLPIPRCKRTGDEIVGEVGAGGAAIGAYTVRVNGSSHSRTGHGSTTKVPGVVSVKRAPAAMPSSVRSSAYLPRDGVPIPEIRLPTLQYTHVPFTCSTGWITCGPCSTMRSMCANAVSSVMN